MSTCGSMGKHIPLDKKKTYSHSPFELACSNFIPLTNVSLVILNSHNVHTSYALEYNAQGILKDVTSGLLQTNVI